MILKNPTWSDTVPEAGQVGFSREEDGPSVNILLLIFTLHQLKLRRRAKGGTPERRAWCLSRSGREACPWAWRLCKHLSGSHSPCFSLRDVGEWGTGMLRGKKMSTGLSSPCWQNKQSKQDCGASLANKES